MSNKYIFFRTDRIGDFLMSAILIKAIKRSDQNAYITVVASKKNHDYIKTFSYVDETILIPENYLKKIYFYTKFFFVKYHLICILDGKKRSLYFSFLNRAKFKFLFTNKKFYKLFFSFFYTKIFLDSCYTSKISEIQDLLNLLEFKLKPEDFKTIFVNTSINNCANLNLSSKYTLFHFDEKWISDHYIPSYKSIEPLSEANLNYFFGKLIVKTGIDLCISSGTLNNKYYDYFRQNFLKISDFVYLKKLSNKKILFFDKLNFYQLQHLIFNCELLITCHGAPTHVAGSFHKKIIDIYDESKKNLYNKWTFHFKNYNFCYRNNFSKLSQQIEDLL
jgi:ADP-heptose:LPS heptosyltransferase